ncbi:hypothetical protein MEU_03929 [Candida albicans P37005]|nr:hypothetical protein MEU_03929 [Candida albicans P37005]
MYNKYSSIRKLRKPLILLLIFNTLYLSFYHYFGNNDSQLTLLNIPLDSTNLLAEYATTDANYTKEVDELIASIEPPIVTSEYRIPKRTNQIFQDPRLTFGLILNYVNQNPSSSIPFHWSDWVDLSLLNNQLNKPIEKRLKCLDILNHIHLQFDKDRELCRENTRYFGCADSESLSASELQEYGVDSHEQLPGFIQFEHTVFSSTEYVRNLQGKTYVLASMPIPYKVIFMNDKGEDLVFDVHKERIDKLKDNYKKSKIDPVVEFEKLTQGSNSYKPKPIIDIPLSDFEYEKEFVLESIKSLEAKPELDQHQKSYLWSMKKSIAIQESSDSETRYFNEATMTVGNGNEDSGWHYDWRFFNGKLRDGARTAIILERLLRNWFRFTEKYGVVSWIAHGPLLSWYWNGAIFPYDNDLDVQMPIKQLARLGELYNQTLVVEDLREGFGKYLIDVGTFIHNRDISNDGNHIDARFIDVDTGVYIDITGLSNVLVNRASRYDGRDIHDRRKHFYKLNDLAPVKLSMLNGVPCYISNHIVQNLKREYRSGISRKQYQDYIFSNKLNIWVHTSVLADALEKNDYINSSGNISNLQMKFLINEMTDDQIYQMLSNNNQLLLDYQLARSVRKFHAKELKYLTSFTNKGRAIDNDDITEEYKNLLGTVTLHEPFRESLFEYERVNGGLDTFYEEYNREIDSLTVS